MPVENGPWKIFNNRHEAGSGNTEGPPGLFDHFCKFVRVTLQQYF